MCGILGFCGKGGENDAARMLGTIAHRGPDDKGIVATPDVTFGFARLSIIDTTLGSHQPMWSEDKGVCIVFNGEIYNFKELRAELEKKGRKFKTTGDTEVIVNAYLEYGEKCFERLHGMFAIGIYDFKKNRLLLARDRLGKKPLYYFNEKGTFAFASELKALQTHPEFKKEIDMQSLDLYLMYDYVPTPRTIYTSAKKLEPGTFLVYEDGKTRRQKFWSLDPQEFQGTFDEAKNELDRLIDQSVKDRLVADVPLGVFLSGGLDSSTVSYYAQKNVDSKIKTFSVGFEDASFDESAHARLVSSFLQTEHLEKTMKASDLFDVFGHLGTLVDEPLADASIAPTYLLSKFTKEHVTVALGGDGADELFAGYPTFLADKMAGGYAALPLALRNAFKKFAYALPVYHSNFNLPFILRKFSDAGEGEIAHTHQRWLGSFMEEERDELFHPCMRPKNADTEEFRHIDELLAEASGMSSGNQNLYSYLRSYLMDAVMVKVDRASMFASLEARSPLLDHRLVEFAFSLPYEWKAKGITTKYILKKLMEDKLPSGIVYRKKKGFGMPIGRWMQNELKPLVEKTLSKQRIKKEGIFDEEYVERLKGEHMSGKMDHRKKLWNLMVFHLWRDSSGA